MESKDKYDISALPVDIAAGTTTEFSAPKPGFLHAVDRFLKLDTASDERRSNEG